MKNFSKWFRRFSTMKLSEKNWLIEQESFGVSHKHETCFALTNGYI